MIRPIRAVWLVAALALAGVATPARPATLFEPPVQKTLANGLRVVVFPRAGTGFVQVQLSLAAGTGAEADDQRGAAPLAAQLLRLGTSSRSAEAFGGEVDRLGGSFASAVQRDNAAVGATFLPADLESGLELLSDAVINPIFEAEAFERLRNQAVRELVRMHSDPAATTDEQLWNFALPGFAPAREPLGNLASLFALTRESVRGFHRDAYRPDRAVLAIAGDVTPQRAFELATEWFARWSGRALVTPARSIAKASGTRILLVDRPGLTTASVRLGWQVPGREAADDLARTVAVTLFSAALEARLAGRLPGGSTLNTSFAQVREAGLLNVRFEPPVDSAAVAIERVIRTALLVRDIAPAPAKLAALVRQLRGAYPLRFGTTGGLVSQWLSADAAGADPDQALATYLTRAGQLDAAALSAALQRGWSPKDIAIVVIGPAERLRAPLARLGAVQEVRLDEPAPAPVVAPDSVATPTAAERRLGRERIVKVIAAHGGLAKLRGVRDVVSEARIQLDIQGRELKGEFRQIRKEPLRMVYLTSFESFETRQVLNGEHAWSVTGDNKLQEADSAGVRALQSGFASDVPHLLLAAADSATQVADRGSVKIGGLDTWAVDVRAAGAQRRRFYLDPATSRLVAMDQNEESGRPSHLGARRLYRDLREVDGLWVPFEEERQIDGRTVMRVFVTRFQFNTGVKDEEFLRPSSAPAAPPRK